MLHDSRLMRLALGRLALFACLIGAWFYGANQLGATTMPSPPVVIRELGNLLQSPELWGDIALSMKQVGITLVIALVVGVGVGVLGWRYAAIRKAVFPWMSMLNTVPPVLLYPVAIIFFGLGTASTVVLSIFLGGMVMAESTYAGLRSVERVHLEVASIYQASRIDVFRKVLLPGAMEVIATGLRIGFTLVFILVIATGYILSGGGLGYRLRFFYESFEMPKLYALVLVVITLSLACQFLLLGVLRLVRRSGQSSAKDVLLSSRADIAAAG